MKTQRQEATEIFQSALQAANPYRAVVQHGEAIRFAYIDGNCDNLYAVAFGKAAWGMMQAITDTNRDILTKGIVITKYGHAGGSPADRVTVYEAGHPLPDNNGVRATAEVIALAERLRENDLLVCLVSGGGSALLAAPYGYITLKEKQQATELLLAAGADITELNTVRKHISRVKGGRLAEMAYPARIRSLIVSDVMDDTLDVIASGPTVPDRTTYTDALRVITKYGLLDRIPASVRETLRGGAAGRIPETPKEGNRVFAHVDNLIIGSSKHAIRAAGHHAAGMGFEVALRPGYVHGEAREAACNLAREVLAAETAARQAQGKTICMISGGETTVTVRGRGKGGRNMEFALAFALAIEGSRGITLLSAGTDGTDGPTNAAGAIIDGQTAANSRLAGVRPEDYLENNDSYSFFERIGELFVTGPTGTNVMDIQIVLVAPD